MIAGRSAMWTMPSTEMRQRNRQIITGPNITPTRAVPRAWIANSPTRMPMRDRHDDTAARPVDRGQALDRREDRDRRSDHRIAVEERGRRRRRAGRCRGPALLPAEVLRLISASRARLPPSPLLSARMMIATYLTVTTIIIDQKISREHAEDVGSVRRQRMVARERLAEGVDRARCRYRRTRLPIAPMAIL